jgi:hypothetical protein
MADALKAGPAAGFLNTPQFYHALRRKCSVRIEKMSYSVISIVARHPR